MYRLNSFYLTWGSVGGGGYTSAGSFPRSLTWPMSWRGCRKTGSASSSAPGCSQTEKKGIRSPFLSIVFINLIFVIHRPLLNLEHQLKMPPLQLVIVGPVGWVEVVIGGHGGVRLVQVQVVQHLAQLKVLNVVLARRQLLHLRYKMLNVIG